LRTSLVEKKRGRRGGSLQWLSNCSVPAGKATNKEIQNKNEKKKENDGSSDKRNLCFKPRKGKAGKWKTQQSKKKGLEARVLKEMEINKEIMFNFAKQDNKIVQVIQEVREKGFPFQANSYIKIRIYEISHQLYLNWAPYDCEF